MGIFGSKKPADVCPACGQRLFMENPDGTRTCVKCGYKIGQKEGGVYRSAAKNEADSKPVSAKTAPCPSCGSNAELFSIEANGAEIYRCSFCGNQFEKKEKAPRGPIGPSKKEPDVLDGKGVFDLAKANTVEVHAVFGKMGAAGSGFFIEKGLVMTNCHVISDHEDGWKLAEKVTINYKGGKRYDALVAAYNKEQDMAMLVTDMPCSQVAKIAEQLPDTGVTIYAVGNTKGEGMCILEGIVADSSREIEGLPFTMISANTFHGNSGGPVFNNKGEVVGILTLGDREVVSMNYAIPVTRVRAFIQAAKQSLAKQMPGRGGSGRGGYSRQVSTSDLSYKIQGMYYGGVEVASVAIYDYSGIEVNLTLRVIQTSSSYTENDRYYDTRELIEKVKGVLADEGIGSATINTSWC